jgi:hypothetical protein
MQKKTNLKAGVGKEKRGEKRKEIKRYKNRK